MPLPKLPDICFGVSQLRSGTIRRRLAAKGIMVTAAVRQGGLTYLGFATERLHERAVRWIYRWYELEFHLSHWKCTP